MNAKFLKRLISPLDDDANVEFVVYKDRRNNCGRTQKISSVSEKRN